MASEPIKKSISVILPAHNEAANIEPVIAKCVSICSKLFNDFEVLAVDDGSADGTGALVEKIAEKDRRVRLVTHPVNRGYGAALRSGFAAATKQWVFFTDSDGQFDPAEVADFVPLLDKADIVAGYRLKRQDNFYRRMMGWLYTFLVDLFFGTGVKDINCAFKFIRADFLKGFLLSSEGALINAEIISLARRQKLNIVQKGVHHYPRRSGKQSGGSARVISKALKEYVELYRRLKKM